MYHLVYFVGYNVYAKIQFHCFTIGGHNLKKDSYSNKFVPIVTNFLWYLRISICSRVSVLIAIDSLSTRIKSWWRCENLESTSWILVWIRRRLFKGLEFMFTYFYVHFRCFKCDHNTYPLHLRSRETKLHTNPYSFQGVGSENHVLYSNIAAPFSSVS